MNCLRRQLVSTKLEISFYLVYAAVQGWGGWRVSTIFTYRMPKYFEMLMIKRIAHLTYTDHTPYQVELI